MQYLKYLHFIFPVIIAFIVLSIIIRNSKINRFERKIRSNPVYVQGTITKIVPDAPSKMGVVNIEVDYEFISEEGNIYRNKHVRTAINTIDLYNYKVGTILPVVYLKTDPSCNIPDVKFETTQ